MVFDQGHLQRFVCEYLDDQVLGLFGKRRRELQICSAAIWGRLFTDACLPSAQHIRGTGGQYLHRSKHCNEKSKV